MITLHSVISETRTILKWGALLIGIVLLAFFLFSGGKVVKEMFFPTPAPAPTVLFGKIPSILFPENASNFTFSYTINTVSGSLPTFSDRMTVYKLQFPKPNLLALSRAKQLVKAVGFTNDPVALTPTLYEWLDTHAPARKLHLDILTLNLKLTSDYTNDPDVLSAAHLGTEQEAISKGENFLSALSLLYPDIDRSKTKTALFDIANNQLVAATSLSSTKVIKVNFFQNDIDNFPIKYPHPDSSTMNVTIGSVNLTHPIVEATLFHQATESASQDSKPISATYPIKTANEALEDLKKQKGYIASYFGNSPAVSIKNVSLAYYQADAQQLYLSPIIVFEGDSGFVAYVPAVKDEWIQ
jgi:hypothetical protein